MTQHCYLTVKSITMKSFVEFDSSYRAELTREVFRIKKIKNYDIRWCTIYAHFLNVDTHLSVNEFN